MHQTLQVFQTAAAMAQHAGSRQALVAQNVANADTPGYQARHISAFQDHYSVQTDGTMRATRAAHLSGTGGQMATITPDTGGTPSPNGNTVSIEEEMMNAINISREHNRAVSIYQHALGVLRTSLGRG